MEPIHEERYRGYTIKIMPDENPDSPRDWDNLGKMVCFHRRYTLGDKHDIRHEDFGGWDEMEAYIRKKLHGLVVLPLYLYDHSVQSISTQSFHGRAQHAEWDSGRVGFIYADEAAIRKEYELLDPSKKIHKDVLEKVGKILEDEVTTYDDYLRGNVYGYRVLDDEGNDVDSCWKFFGDYNGDYGALKEARSVVDAHAKKNKQNFVGRGI